MAGRYGLLLLALEALWLGVLWLGARGLGQRLPRPVLLAGFALPWLLLWPWVSESTRLLVPSQCLIGQVPGTPLVVNQDPYAELSDTVFQFLPWELEVRRAFKEGRLPLWSDLADGGSGLWANPQAGALSPLAMAARLLPIQHFFFATLVLKLATAFLGGWLLARRVGARRLGAWLAGTSFALGGGLLGWSLFPHSSAAAFIPWVVLGAVQAWRRPRPRTLATTALATAALALAGHPETALAGGLLAAGAALALRHRRRPFARPLAAVSLAAGLGVGLAAVQLLPFAGLAQESQRAAEAVSFRQVLASPGPPGPWSWSFLGRGNLVLSPLSPHALGRPYREPYPGMASWPDTTAGYAGLLALGGAAAALAARRRRALPWLALAGGCLLLAVQARPLLRLLYQVPLLELFTWPRFFLPFTLALALAGAFGLEELLRGKRLAPWLGLAAAVAASLALRHDAWCLSLWLGLVSGLLAVRLLRGPGTPLARSLRASLPVLLVLVDLVPWGRSLLPKGDPNLFYPPSAPARALQAENEAPGGPWRSAAQYYLFYPNLPGFYGLADPRPHNPLAPQGQIDALAAAFDYQPSVFRYVTPFNRPDQPFLDFLNVRTVLSNSLLPDRPTTLEPLPSRGLEPYQLWRNPNALPRWFFATRATPLPGPEALRGWLADLQDAHQVVVYAAEAAQLPKELAPSPGPPELVALHPGQVSLRFPASSTPRLLATSLPDPANWQARTANQPLPTLTVNAGYLGVLIPPGATEATLRYIPRGLMVGALLSLVSAVVIGGLLVR